MGQSAARALEQDRAAAALKTKVRIFFMREWL
jgi:hypothetical protein